MRKEKLMSFCYVLVTLLFLTGCKSVGLMSDDNSWLPEEVESFGDFFSVYFVIQISVIIISLLLSFILGKGGYIVALILHFIWIISYRDYGFFKVLLLFGLFSIISLGINSLNLFKRNNN